MKAFKQFFDRYFRHIATAVIIAFSIFFAPFALGMALGKSRDKFNTKGGGFLKSYILETGGVVQTMTDVGYLGETNWNVDPKMITFDDERGYIINALPSGEEWRIKSTLMQTSKDEYDLIRNGWNEYRHFYYKMELENGNIQEIYIPLGKIIVPIDVKFKAGEKRNIPIEILALMGKHTGTVTVAPTAFNVPEGAYGVMTENATAHGEVTTANGTLYSDFV